MSSNRSESFRIVSRVRVFALVLPMAACAGLGEYSRVDTGYSTPSVDTTSGQSRDTEGNQIHSISVRVHYSGWKYYPDDKRQVSEALAEHGLSEDPNAPIMIRIILEQTYVTKPAWLKLPNTILFVASALTFPLYDRYDFRLRFIVTDGNEELAEESYSVRNRTFVSLLALPIMPFFWPPSTRIDSFTAATGEFATSLRSALP